MRTNKELEKIIADIKQLPVIKDKTDKSELYTRISSEMKDSQKVKPKRKRQIKAVPVLATVLVTVLLAIIPFILYNTSNQQADNAINHNAADTYSTEESGKMESNDEQEANSGDIADDNQEESLDESTEIRMAMDQTPAQSHVISADEGGTLIYGAVADANNQYIIPVTFVAEGSVDVAAYYNQLAALIQEDTWNTAGYLLEGASFELNREDREVFIELGDEFSIGEGSANAYVFEQMLEMMFTPLGIEKAIFKGGVDLGPIGFVEEMNLHPDKVVYKLYNKEFLIAVPASNDLSIEEAISEMSQNDPDFNIKQTIPNEIQLEVQSSGNLLELTFVDEQVFTDKQDVLTMVEAILMTAKSYGFEKVQFQNSPLQQVSKYNFSDPIRVPKAANPVDLRR
ncbi:hypothetical protein NSQ77_20485 [Oceanobacillus sp. FSL K6-2867]|uniref:hypothetical protein n=1 Tax=Oceanobacillus sp. FSL K6-2867 TaxID=2954748 RepID=UPI0030DB00B6